jgi:hypothetical protein
MKNAELESQLSLKATTPSVNEIAEDCQKGKGISGEGEEINTLRHENHLLRELVEELQQEVESLNRQVLGLLQDNRGKLNRKETQDGWRESIGNRANRSPISKTVTINLENNEPVGKLTKPFGSSADKIDQSQRSASKPKERRKILTLLKTRDGK